MLSSAAITEIIVQAARGAGFELAGIAGVEDTRELEYFPQWIAEGRAGERKYMEARDEQGRLKRASVANAAPWARSVVVCAINYNTAQPYSTQVADAERGWISRYAWGREDYHEAVMRRLRKVEAAMKSSCGDDLVTRCYVDTGPVVERVVAKYSGVGWIGKNTCIIHQKLGSWLFLGVILSSLEIEGEATARSRRINSRERRTEVSQGTESRALPEPVHVIASSLIAPDRCGTCTRCIEACPTDALTAPYQLDSNLCISYLTIEKRGAIPEEIRSGMGRHVFGCDICQDVCPWNRKAPVTNAAEFQPREELVNPALEWLAEISVEEFRETFRGSPVWRTKRAGLRRNAVIAMGNSGDRKFLPLLENLKADEDEVVRQNAGWGIRRLEDPE